LNMTNDEVAYKQLLDKIGEGYASNYLLNFAVARLAHSLGENELCIKVLENRPAVQGEYPFHYLDYLLGMSYLYKLEYEKSEEYFTLFLANFKGNNYIKSAFHKLAWIGFLQGEDNNYFEKVKLEGSTSIDEDKVALKEADKGYFSNPILLKARLLYDGGYYKDALTEINKTNAVVNAEYYYRLARIKFKLDYDNIEVVASYKDAYGLGKESTTYYAPMSALQIGLIYEKENDYKQAKIYFEKCLSLSDFDYERGIHQKAKSALDRIN